MRYVATGGFAIEADSKDEAIEILNDFIHAANKNGDGPSVWEDDNIEEEE